ncbi:hypothetical protein LTR56_025212 [Elasticomyces elasticus]|nr:hypothetical protein LTR22_027857 [Elasticomyces elasticus]KAK3617557.1 hypothetical protein LTR56_025212 [Elasticomyces elasticus]
MNSWHRSLGRILNLKNTLTKFIKTHEVDCDRVKEEKYFPKQDSLSPIDWHVNKLTNTILSIITENAILKAQNSGLKEAIYNEKKRRKRGKQLAQEGHGATFFSPIKIQQAKDLQDQRESGKLAVAKDKQLKAQAKKVEKAAKQLSIQQAKQLRQQQAAERKEVAKAEQRRKEVDKEVGMASRQLQQTLLASAMKPKKRSKVLVLHLPPYLLLKLDISCKLVEGKYQRQRLASDNHAS